MTVETIYNVFRLLTIIAAILAAVGAVGTYCLSKRIDVNREQKIRSLEMQLTEEKKTIKNCESILTVTFTGQWKDPPIVRMMSPTNHEVYVILQSKDDNKAIFYATEPYDFKKIDDNTLQFVSRQSVHKGEFPIGASSDELRNIQKATIQIPFIAHNSILNKIITVKKVDLSIIVNGKPIEPIVIEQDQDVPITVVKNYGWAVIELKTH